MVRLAIRIAIMRHHFGRSRTFLPSVNVPPVADFGRTIESKNLKRINP